MLTNINSKLQIEDYLIGYNLDDQTLKLLDELFGNEYAIALYDEGFLIGIESSERIPVELNKLAAYFNPETISYPLPDGSIARQSVPGGENQYFELSEGTYIFELDQPLYMIQDEITLISNSEALLSTEDHYQAEGFEQIISIADEIVQIHPSKLHEFVEAYLDLSDLPTITSGFNYFDDGIQTVHFLAW